MRRCGVQLRSPPSIMQAAVMRRSCMRRSCGGHACGGHRSCTPHRAAIPPQPPVPAYNREFSAWGCVFCNTNSTGTPQRATSPPLLRQQRPVQSSSGCCKSPHVLLCKHAIPLFHGVGNAHVSVPVCSHTLNVLDACSGQLRQHTGGRGRTAADRCTTAATVGGAVHHRGRQ